MPTRSASRQASDMDPAAYPDSSNSLLGCSPDSLQGLPEKWPQSVTSTLAS